MNLFKSEKWTRFLESTAEALQVNLGYSAESDELIPVHSNCLCCGRELWNGDLNNPCREIFRLEGKYMVVALDHKCCPAGGILSFDEKADIVSKMLAEFCGAIFNACEGQVLSALQTLHQYGHLVLSAFRGNKNALESVLNLLLSAAIVLFDADGTWLDCAADGDTIFLSKGLSDSAVEHSSLIIKNMVAAEIHSPAVEGIIGISAPDNLIKANRYLDSMAYECTSVFEISRLFQIVESKLALILNAVDNQVLMADSKKHICFANTAAVKLLRRSLSELMNMPVNNIDTPWRQCILSESDQIKKGTGDVLLCGTDERLIDWEVIPLTEGHDMPGWLIVARDRTDCCRLQELSDRTEHIVRASTLLSVIAHEIRNPLATFKGLLQIIDLKSRAPEISKYVGIGMNEIRKISLLLDEFSQTGRLAETVLEKTELYDFMQEVYDLAFSGFNGPKIEFAAAFSTVSPVMADKRQLMQALFNLIKNAYEALNQRGKITISLLAYDKDWIEISVCDNGPGIPDYAMDKLFKPYYSTKDEGIGLGLAIVKSIVKNHKGRISAYNNPDGGACFSILLPVCDE